MTQAKWTAVDDFFETALRLSDPALEAALAANRAAGLPGIDVSPAQGKLLHILARMVGAKRILEIGALGGYSSIWLARALAPGGRLVSLEISPKHAEVARANLAQAGFGESAEVRVGPALESLAELKKEAGAPFDFVFIDADKPNNANYLKAALGLTRPGAVIVCDNVVRDGTIADAASREANVLGARALFDAIAAEPRLSGVGVQTVGVKGWDGFAIAFVN